MPIDSFSPTGQATLAANQVSQNVAIPAAGNPTTLVVTNLGPSDAFVLLGNADVVVTPQTGMAIPAGSSRSLTLGANTNLAAITTTAQPAVLNITPGI